MAKWYALGMLVGFLLINAVFGVVLGSWGAVPAGVILTLALAAMGRSQLRSASTAATMSIVAGLFTIVGTIVALAKVAVDASHTGVWWPAAVEVALAVILLVAAAWLLVSRRRSPKFKAAQEANRAHRAATTSAVQAHNTQRLEAQRTGTYTHRSQLPFRLSGRLGSVTGLALKLARQHPDAAAPGPVRDKVRAQLQRTASDTPVLLTFAIDGVRKDQQASPAVINLAVELLTEAAAGPRVS
jgi:hypothetical protein